MPQRQEQKGNALTDLLVSEERNTFINILSHPRIRVCIKTIDVLSEFSAKFISQHSDVAASVPFGSIFFFYDSVVREAEGDTST